ncbi:MAG TPA: ELWxxDGT repeat protein, partial [Thermoanaerobaculia bacterium]|nr:ELWxxDGT repeat protein [Thermoanaerobaculia bacterium]
MSDGTAGGTRPLTNFAPAEPFQETYFLKTLAGKVYFVANDIIHGEELWASDGTPQGTVRVTEFGFHAPFTGGSFSFGLHSYALEKLGDRIVFWATDGLTGFKLWSTRGTTPSTSPVCASCSFTSGENPQFVLKDGRILFRADDGRHGLEPWTSDGTESGTRLLKDFCPGSCTGSYGFAETGGKVFISSGEALWVTDGRPEGIRRFAAVSPDFPSNLESKVATADNKVFYFVGSLPSKPRELWASDGTPAGTRQITSTAIGTDSAEISQILHANGRIYFTVCEGSFQKQVWTSRGTPESTLATQAPAAAACFEEEARLVAAGGKVFLLSDPDRDAEQLWRLEDDGGATKLSDFQEFRAIGSVADYKGLLYFSVLEDGGGSLWRSDGTPQGTVPAVHLASVQSGAQFLRAAGDLLWFMIDSHFSDETGIWRTDGTPAGTRSILSGASRFDPEFLAIGPQTFFVASKPDSDFEDIQVWRTDGTPDGTVQITDFPTRNAPRAYPAELTALGGNLYFLATPPAGGRGLWRSDGTPNGAVLLKTFPALGLDAFKPRRFGLATLGSWLIFAIEDGTHGTELWRSDGTAAGTTLLRDIFPGPGSSSPSGFVAAGGMLYFSANDGAHG